MSRLAWMVCGCLAALGGGGALAAAQPNDPAADTAIPLTKAQAEAAIRLHRLANDAVLKTSVVGHFVELDLAGSKATTADLALLSQFPGLQVLNLSATAIDDAGVARLAGLKNLRSLSLHQTGVTDEALRTIGQLGELTELNLGNCPRVSDAGIAHLRKLTRLVELNLVHTRLSDAGLKQLTALRHLRGLVIGGPQVTDSCMDHLAKLPQLRGLVVTDAAVTDTGLQRLDDLPDLAFLSLYGNRRVTDAGLVFVGRRTRLEVLALGKTGITDAGLKHLQSLEDLKHLSLVENRHVTDAGLAQLAALPKLEKVDISGTSVTATGLVEFKGRRPKADVYNDLPPGELAEAMTAYAQRQEQQAELRKQIPAARYVGVWRGKLNNDLRAQFTLKPTDEENRLAVELQLEEIAGQPRQKSSGFGMVQDGVLTAGAYSLSITPANFDEAELLVEGWERAILLVRQPPDPEPPAGVDREKFAAFVRAGRIYRKQYEADDPDIAAALVKLFPFAVQELYPFATKVAVHRGADEWTFQRVRLNTLGQGVDVIAFSTPPGDAAWDLHWEFVFPADCAFDGWYIVPRRGILEDGFTGFETVENFQLPGAALPQENTLVKQSLDTGVLPPGSDWLLRFSFRDERPVDFHVRIRLVPHADPDPE